MNVSVTVPTKPPTVTTNGSAIAPMHIVLVEDDHDSVEHSAEPRRPEGVESVKAKLTPITEMLLVTCEPAMLATAPRVLTAGAATDVSAPSVWQGGTADASQRDVPKHGRAVRRCRRT